MHDDLLTYTSCRQLSMTIFPLGRSHPTNNLQLEIVAKLPEYNKTLHALVPRTHHHIDSEVLKSIVKIMSWWSKPHRYRIRQNDTAQGIDATFCEEEEQNKFQRINASGSSVSLESFHSALSEIFNDQIELVDIAPRPRSAPSNDGPIETFQSRPNGLGNGWRIRNRFSFTPEKAMHEED
ncbi:hypothetical protein RUND412_008453 [Rhizina undulata]